jgi:hypothetical protein
MFIDKNTSLKKLLLVICNLSGEFVDNNFTNRFTDSKNKPKIKTYLLHSLVFPLTNMIYP